MLLHFLRFEKITLSKSSHCKLIHIHDRESTKFRKDKKKTLKITCDLSLLLPHSWQCGVFLPLLSAQAVQAGGHSTTPAAVHTGQLPALPLAATFQGFICSSTESTPPSQDKGEASMFQEEDVQPSSSLRSTPRSALVS